ncbi:MAG: S8 family serine peptidase [Oscillochloridaceae bacterium]|nr:S8 family serine peptidase [Chloroflexaceae bacterium]MDW8389465.1 S8 family serine peptidase [Oscillochloridaceae bacterium]
MRLPIPRSLRAFTLIALALLLLVLVRPARADEANEPPPVAPVEQIIVRFPSSDDTGRETLASPSQAAAQLSAQAATPLEYVRTLADGAHVLRLPEPLPPEEAWRLAQRLAAVSGAEYVEPDLIFFPTVVPDDTLYAAAQWNLQSVTSARYGANFPDAWMITTGSPAIVSAILDTGGLLTHEDLAGRTPAGNPGYDFISTLFNANDGNGRDPDPSDPGDWVTSAEATGNCPVSPSSWHGSHVAGIFGARANNDRGIAGAVWDAPMLIVRVLGKCGGTLSDIADALRWAAGLPVPGVPDNPTPARVLNLSLGGGGSTCPATMQNAINAANQAGAIVVVAAGNSNTSASSMIPANCSGVVVVAASTLSGNRASYSNYGSLVTLAAPGGDTGATVVSTVNSSTTAPSPTGDTYAGYRGTSMATPHVAGAISLMLSANPGLSRAEVLQILRDTVTPFPGGSGCIGRCGTGILNAGAAVEEAARRVRQLSFTDNPRVVSEGDEVTITLTLNLASNREVSAPYTVGGTASQADHTLRQGSIVFPPGQRSATLRFRVESDAERDPGETITITLGDPERATLAGPSSLTLIIQDTTASGRLALDASTLDFGAHRLGTAATLPVMVANGGGAPIAVTRLDLEGSFARRGGTCPAAFPFDLAPGASCTLLIAFTPTTVGTHAGRAVFVTTEGEGGNLALRGIGSEARVALPLVRW